MGRYGDPLFQQSALFKVVMAPHYSTRPERLLSGAEFIELLHSISSLRRFRADGVQGLLRYMAVANRRIDSAVPRSGTVSPSRQFEALAAVLRTLSTPKDVGDFFRSWFTCGFIESAWEAAAEDRPGSPEKAAACELLEAVSRLIAAPVKQKQVDRRVATYRRAAARKMLGTLPAVMRNVAKQNVATRGLLDHSRIVARLHEWEMEDFRREHGPNATFAGGTIHFVPIVPCPTCMGDHRFGKVASALALYRRERAGLPGPLPLREVAAAILLHRCPDRLDSKAVRRALDRLKTRTRRPRRTKGSTSQG